MLESLRLIDFKSFVDDTIPFSPVTYLMGANGAGKSNVLDALRFLKALPVVGPLDALDRPFDESDTVRGGSADAARHGTHSFAIHSRWTLADRTKPAIEVEHQIRCEVRPAVRRLVERLLDDRGQEIAASSPSDEAGQSILGFHTVLPPGPDALSLRLPGITFVDDCPESMRRPSPPSHWSSAWHRVARHHRPQARERFTNFIDWANEASGSMLRTLDFIEDDEGVTVVFVERDGRRILTRSVSDGLLRCLEIFTSVLFAKPGSIVCVEAPTAGLHPARARLMVELFERASQDCKIQIIVTTHDASLLRWLDDEHLGQVVLLARNAEHPASVARRLADLPGFFDAKRSLGLEEMIATEWLEAAL